jgi:hypothetical protein
VAQQEGRHAFTAAFEWVVLGRPRFREGLALERERRGHCAADDRHVPGERARSEAFARRGAAAIHAGDDRPGSIRCRGRSAAVGSFCRCGRACKAPVRRTAPQYASRCRPPLRQHDQLEWTLLHRINAPVGTKRSIAASHKIRKIRSLLTKKRTDMVEVVAPRCLSNAVPKVTRPPQWAAAVHGAKIKL